YVPLVVETRRAQSCRNVRQIRDAADARRRRDQRLSQPRVTTDAIVRRGKCLAAPVVTACARRTSRLRGPVQLLAVAQVRRRHGEELVVAAGACRTATLRVPRMVEVRSAERRLVLHLRRQTTRRLRNDARDRL